MVEKVDAVLEFQIVLVSVLVMGRLMDKHDKLDKLPLEHECDGVYGHVSVLVGN